MTEDKGDKKGMVAKAVLAAGLMWKGAKMVKPENREEFMEVVKDPKTWGEKISDAWDWTLIEAGETKDAIVILAKIALARNVSAREMKDTAEQLGEIGLLIPPLRVFAIPGSWLLLGTLSKLTPWHLMPEINLPDLDLRKALMERFGQGESTGFENEADAALKALEDE